jgi:hypothetical protein
MRYYESFKLDNCEKAISIYIYTIKPSREASSSRGYALSELRQSCGAGITQAELRCEVCG